MLSRKTVNNTGHGDHCKHEASSEPHIVVGCPYCQTKFAVEGGLVASYETPTFHCSRCDAVFEYTTLRKSAPTKGLGEDTNTLKQSTILPSDFSLGDLDSNTDNNTRPKKTSWIEQSAGKALLGLSDTNTSPFSITREEFVARAERLGIDSSSAKDLETSVESSDRSAKDSFDIFSIFDSPLSNNRTQESTDRDPIESPTTSNGTQISLQVSSPQISPNDAVSSFPTGTKQQYGEHHGGATIQEYRGTAVEQRNPKQPSGATSKGNIEQHNNRLKNKLEGLLGTLLAKNKDLSRMLRPLIKVTVGVLVLAILTQMMPKTIDNVFGAVIPRAISGKRLYLPSADLSVHDLTFNFEKTISGETIPVVRGMVSNSGKTSFQDVMVEAIGFDSRGATVMRIKAPLRSALNREKLSDISVEDAKKFQTAIHTVASTIKANETLPFTIAMVSEKPVYGDIAFFSARVFSFGK